jgi:drug/metabolite transporter (DMT)-like permease
MTAPPLAFVYLALLALMWGSSYALIKLMVETIPPVTGTAIRMMLACAVLWLAMVWRGERWPIEPATWLKLFVVGMVGGAAPFTLIAFATERIPSGLAAILMASAPTFTMTLAHFATHDDRISAGKSVGVAVGFVGIVLLFGSNAVLGADLSLFGMAAVILAAFLYAATNVLARTVQHVPPVAAGTVASLGAALVLLPAAFLVETPVATLTTAPPGALSWIALGLLAVFSSALANVLFYRLIVLAGSTFISFNNYLSPMVGVFWGVAILGEALRWNAFAALIFILAGIAIANLGALRAMLERKPRPA